MPLLPKEMSALALLAGSEGCRDDLRADIAESLSGEAKLIATALLYGIRPGVDLSHLESARRLKEWAARIKDRRR